MQYSWRHDILSFPADSHGSIRKQRSQIAPRLFAAIGRTAPRAARAAASVLLFAACLPFAAQAQTDTTQPTVSINAPLSGTTVSGTINVTMSASDNVDVLGVHLFLDGAPLGSGSDATNAA